MKLYTEEQIKSIYRIGIIDGKCGADINNIDYLMFDGLTPIDLPSDEEIEQEAQKRHPYEKHMGATWENGLHEGFIMGAECIKEQILNKNK